MADWVPVAELNNILFKSYPKPLDKLQRWCREEKLPARKFGGEWHVDLEQMKESRVNTNSAIVSMVKAGL